MFEYFLKFLMQFVGALAGKGVKVNGFSFICAECVEIELTDNESKLEIVRFVSEFNDEICIYIHDPDDEGEHKQVSFHVTDGLSIDQFITAFMMLVNTDKLKPPVVTSVRKEERKYFFQKKCDTCKTVFYEKEIYGPAYENLTDNPNISFESIDGVKFYATLTSVCQNCNH